MHTFQKYMLRTETTHVARFILNTNYSNVSKATFMLKLTTASIPCLKHEKINKG